MEPPKKSKMLNAPPEKRSPPHSEVASGNGEAQYKHGHRLYQSPSVKTAGLNKSPGRILRSTNRRHALMAMGQNEKQKLNDKVRLKLMGESLKRRLDKEERDDSENEPHKKRESGKEPEKTHCCNNGSHTNEQNKHNLVTQNVIIENNGDDDDDDI